MIVAKFGGTSVSSEKRIRTLCRIVENELDRNPVVVVSALSGVTDLLLSGNNFRKIRSLHEDLVRELFASKKLQADTMRFIDSQLNSVAQIIANRGEEDKNEFLDRIVSFGEIMSTYIITQALKSEGIKATQIIATDLIVTNNNFGSAEVLLGLTRRNVRKVLRPLLKAGLVPVVPGFIGSTRSGQITTLGRGGSDYTASIVGFCLGASEIQIWTDVDGIFTSDPRLVKNAKPLPVISFKEASELAAFGARILHPQTIRPAIRANIPVKVLNTFNPENPGTLITEKSVTTCKVKAISFKRTITLVNIYSTEMLWQVGYLARLFKVFKKYGISVDLVSVSEVSVSVSLDNQGDLKNAVEEISKFSSVLVSSDCGMVSLIGEDITGSSHIIKKVFGILDEANILARMISLSAANINISIVIDADKVEQAVKILHDRLLFKQDQ